MVAVEIRAEEHWQWALAVIRARISSKWIGGPSTGPNFKVISRKVALPPRGRFVFAVDVGGRLLGAGGAWPYVVFKRAFSSGRGTGRSICARW